MLIQEECEDTNWVIRSRKLKGRQHNDQKKKDKRPKKIYKTFHRKLKIEQHEPHYKPGMNSGSPEG